MSFTCAISAGILADRATWDKLFCWTFFTVEATRLKLQLSHYPVSLLSRCMMRRESVWPPRGSTKGWIQRGAPRGQAGGRPSWGAPASHHLHTAACPVSLDMNPCTHPPLLTPSPLTPSIPPPLHHPPHPLALTSLICIPVISYSHSYYLPSPSHLSITQPRFYETATLWPQLCALLSFCHRTVAELIFKHNNDNFCANFLLFSPCSCYMPNSI